MYVTILWRALGSPVIDVTVKKGKLLACVLNFFGILVRPYGNVVVRERLGYERSGFEVQVLPWVAIFFHFY